MSDTATDATPEEAVDHTTEHATRGLHSIPIIEQMGIVVDEVEPGRCVVRAPADGNGNHFGTMYAGVLYTLGECPGGVLFFATFDGDRYFPLVTGSSIRYLKPAFGDITVEASMDADEIDRLDREVEEHGKASWDMELELVDGEGDVVATISSHYQMRPLGSLS